MKSILASSFFLFSIAHGAELKVLSNQPGLLKVNKSDLIAAGNGCQKTESGVLINNLSLALSGTGAETRRCTVRIPVQLKTGYYLDAVKQVASASIYKEAGSAASVSLHSTIMNVSVPVAALRLAKEDVLEQDILLIHKTPHSKEIFRKSLCNLNRSENGLLALNITVSGQILEDSSALQLQLNSIALDLRGRVKPCESVVTAL